VKQLIETTFPCQTGNCIETRTETIFWIDEYPKKEPIPIDIRGKSFVLIKTDDELLFTVKNPNRKDIHFLAIDQGIFDGTKEYKLGRCDFALFDETRFCFVENKNVTLKHRGKERIEVYRQLKETIIKFRENLDFGDYKIEAQISFKSSRKIYPRKSSSNQDMEKEFDDELAVALFENNDIEF
jgi:hypothetical protein